MGKTYSWFEHAQQEYSDVFQVILKADDDTYIHLPNLRQELLKKVLPVKPAYYGRLSPDGSFGFHVGMLYGFTSDLLQTLASQGCMAQKKCELEGSEDYIAWKWIQPLSFTTVNSVATFIDHPWSQKLWAAPITNDTVAIHQCKNDTLMALAFYTFHSSALTM